MKPALTLCSFLISLFFRTVYYLQEKTWSAETVIKVPNKKVEGWALPEMPGEWNFTSLIKLFQTMCRSLAID